MVVVVVLLVLVYAVCGMRVRVYVVGEGGNTHHSLGRYSGR